MAIELSIHQVKSIVSELKHFNATEQHKAFSIKELTIIDTYGQKTVISMYADTNQDLNIN